MPYPAKEIVHNLWIGSYATAANHAFLKKHRIKLIVNCAAPYAPTSSYKDADKAELFLLDSSSSRNDLKKALPGTIAHIDRHISQGHGVLVHCVAGISRSATVVAAYLMKRYDLSPELAYRAIKERKPETFETRTIDGRPVFWPVLQWWNTAKRENR